MEENLGEVNTMIDNLRNMAIDMGSEMDSQNRLLKRLDDKVQYYYLSQGWFIIFNIYSVFHIWGPIFKG